MFLLVTCPPNSLIPARRRNKLRKLNPPPPQTNLQPSYEIPSSALSLSPTSYFPPLQLPDIGSLDLHLTNLLETPPYPPPSPSVASGHTSVASHIPLISDHPPERPTLLPSRKLIKRRPSLSTIPSDIYAQISEQEQDGEEENVRSFPTSLQAKGGPRVGPPPVRSKRGTRPFSLLGSKPLYRDIPSPAVFESLARWGRRGIKQTQQQQPIRTGIGHSVCDANNPSQAVGTPRISCWE